MSTYLILLKWTNLVSLLNVIFFWNIYQCLLFSSIKERYSFAPWGATRNPRWQKKGLKLAANHQIGSAMSKHNRSECGWRSLTMSSRKTCLDLRYLPMEFRLFTSRSREVISSGHNKERENRRLTIIDWIFILLFKKEKNITVEGIVIELVSRFNAKMIVLIIFLLTLLNANPLFLQHLFDPGLFLQSILG